MSNNISIPSPGKNLSPGLLHLKIIRLLTEHEMCVCELGVLKRIGLISGRKSGKWTYYSINGTKMVENHDKFKRLVYNAVEERINKGMPASPVLAEGDGYCSARVNTSLKSNNSK